MDVSQTFDALVSTMQWSEIVSTVEDVLLAEMAKVDAQDPVNTSWPQHVYNQELGCHPRQNEDLAVHELSGYFQSFRPFGYLKENEPYLRKPLNASMLFRNEQRPIVVEDTNIRDSDKWKNLTRYKQGKYLMEAEQERLLHVLQHPGWSFKNNYGKKKKRSWKARKATAICRR